MFHIISVFCFISAAFFFLLAVVLCLCCRIFQRLAELFSKKHPTSDRQPSTQVTVLESVMLIHTNEIIP